MYRDLSQSAAQQHSLVCLGYSVEVLSDIVWQAEYGVEWTQYVQQVRHCPEVIKRFSCSTQLGIKF